MNRRLTVVFAVACGLAVANLYYIQPLLSAVARDLHESTGAVGLVVTASQGGYAAGLALLVPLGDLVERRRLVTVVLSGGVLALVASALAPSVAALAAASVAVGLTSVVAQILVPFAASLAGDATRGRVVGTVMSGLLLGVLLARTASGLIAQAAGWRTVYWVAAALMAALVVLLRVELPVVEPPARGAGYGRLLGSVVTLVRQEPVLRRRSVYGAVVFGAFSVFWTSAAFLLAGSPYRYDNAIIGLFGLVGAAGAIAAQVSGRLADRRLTDPATGVFLAVVAASFAALWIGGRHLVPLLVGVIVLDAGVQGAHILNQAAIYRFRPEARSRLTTAYMVSFFAGGSAGSAGSAFVFARHGWPGVCGLGAGLGALGAAAWLAEMSRSRHSRRRARQPA